MNYIENAKRGKALPVFPMHDNLDQVFARP